MNSAAEAIYTVAGAALIVTTLDAAIRTFVLPRGVPVRLTRWVSAVILRAFRAVAMRCREFDTRDRIMALYGPITLMAYPMVWIAGTIAGFTLVYRGAVVDDWAIAFRISGSSLLTLGFEVTSNSWPLVLEFLEATIGLGLVALLIAYLPTIYSSFSRREAFVTKMAVRANTPPSAAALRLAILNIAWSPQSALCIRSGYLSLTAIALNAGYDVPTHPEPTDPISVSKEEFMSAYETLGSHGLPIRPDREAAWNDFRGWRVNYDAALLALCDHTLAPPAMWSGDRVGGSAQ